MTKKELSEIVKQLISKNKTEEALMVLSKFQLSEDDKTVIMLMGRYNRMKHDGLIEKISQEERYRIINKIHMTILDLVEKNELPEFKIPIGKGNIGQVIPPVLNDNDNSNKEKKRKGFFNRIGNLFRKPNLIEGKSYIKLTVSEEFENFDSEKQLEFLSNLKKILGSNKISIKKIEKGSVIITLELSKSSANKLLKLIYTGELEKLGIENAELVKLYRGYNDDQGITKIRNEEFLVFKSNLKNQALENEIKDVLLEMKKKISPNSPYCNEVISLLVRLKNQQKMKRIGIEKSNSINLEVNKITEATLSLIDQIRQNDMKS